MWGHLPVPTRGARTGKMDRRQADRVSGQLVPGGQSSLQPEEPALASVLPTGAWVPALAQWDGTPTQFPVHPGTGFTDPTLTSQKQKSNCPKITRVTGAC
jgi:hypothetical protein